MMVINVAKNVPLINKRVENRLCYISCFNLSKWLFKSRFITRFQVVTTIRKISTSFTLEYYFFVIRISKLNYLMLKCGSNYDYYLNSYYVKELSLQIEIMIIFVVLENEEMKTS